MTHHKDIYSIHDDIPKPVSSLLDLLLYRRVAADLSELNHSFMCLVHIVKIYSLLLLLITTFSYNSSVLSCCFLGVTNVTWLFDLLKRFSADPLLVPVDDHCVLRVNNLPLVFTLV